MKPDFDSRNLTHLTPAFREMATLLLANCKERGVIMRPFFTVRGPAVQARLWCQSRTRSQIEAQVRALQYAGIAWLPSLFNLQWAKTGPRVTQALPGLSWHQWGEALDCFVQGADDTAIWNPRDPGYRVYGEEAQKLGLEAGVFWTRFPDAVHVQFRTAPSPLKTGLTWKEIDAEMKVRFSGK